MNSEVITSRLTAAQADGLACVICRLDYLHIPGCGSVPVRRSVTGSQVFACVGPCVEAARVDSMTMGRRVVVVADEH